MRDVVRSVLDFNFSLTERSVKETEKDDMPDHCVEKRPDSKQVGPHKEICKHLKQSLCHYVTPDRIHILYQGKIN